MERKTKNISHPYSAVKRYLMVTLAVLACLCVSLPLLAQKITATYDYATQVLMVNNESGHVAYLYPKDNKAIDLQAFIQNRMRENGDNTVDSIVTLEDEKSLSIGIDSNQKNGFDTLTVRLLVNTDKSKLKKVKVPIRVSNRLVTESVEQPLNNPFYVKWFSDNKTIAYSIFGALTVLILLVVLVSLSRRKKKVKDGAEENQHVMQVVEEEKPQLSAEDQRSLKTRRFLKGSIAAAIIVSLVLLGFVIYRLMILTGVM